MVIGYLFIWQSIKKAKGVFLEGVKNLVVKGATWKYDAELQSLITVLQDQVG